MDKKIIWILLLACCAWTACGHSTIPKSGEKGPSGESKYSSCYQYASGKDSIRMQLFIEDTGIKGTLVYYNFEKDGNAGSFTGKKKGDTLFADYSFQSEGVSSVREVAFLKKGDELREGFGEVEEREGKMMFKNREALSFPEGRELKKVECSGANRQ